MDDRDDDIISETQCSKLLRASKARVKELTAELAAVSKTLAAVSKARLDAQDTYAGARELLDDAVKLHAQDQKEIARLWNVIADARIALACGRVREKEREETLDLAERPNPVLQQQTPIMRGESLPESLRKEAEVPGVIVRDDKVVCSICGVDMSKLPVVHRRMDCGGTEEKP